MIKNGKVKYKHNADLYSIMYDTFIAFIDPNITISLSYIVSSFTIVCMLLMLYTIYDILNLKKLSEKLFW